MKQKGFTLIELLIVVAIVGLLVAIAVPHLVRISSKSNLVCNKSEMTTWLRECAKYSSVGDCKYKAEVLFCHKESN